MNKALIVRLVLRASLSAILLLALAAAAPAAASAGGSAAYDPFFYGVPQQTATVSLGADATVPLASVSGVMLPYGTGSAPRYVSLSIRDASGAPLDYRHTETDASGYYLMDGFAAGNGTLSADYFGRGVTLSYEDLALAEGANTVDFAPGAVTWTSTEGGPWSGWSNLFIRLGGWSPRGPMAGILYANDASGTGVAWSLPGSLRWALCFYRDNEVSVWSPDTSVFPIAAGELSSGTIAFRQETAARMRMLQPRWASGSPGTVMKMRFENWPAYTRLQLTGWDASFPVTTWSDLAYDVSSAPVAKTFSLKVPKTAKAGKYFMTRGEGWTGAAPISVSTLFQTCTFKPDRTRIARGQATRLRGRIPVWEPGDTGFGARKTVTVWARTRTATDAPATWNPSSAGWRLVAKVRTDKSGRFVTPQLRPKRSTSYVCRYPGDLVHFRAYTSVCRLTVR